MKVRSACSCQPQDARTTAKHTPLSSVPKNSSVPVSGKIWCLAAKSNLLLSSSNSSLTTVAALFAPSAVSGQTEDSSAVLTQRTDRFSSFHSVSPHQRPSTTLYRHHSTPTFHRRRQRRLSSDQLAFDSQSTTNPQKLHRTPRLFRKQRNCGTPVAMAITMKHNSSSSSNCSVRSYASSSGETRATCYAVSLRDTAVNGFHYSTTGAAGVEWWA